MRLSTCFILGLLVEQGLGQSLIEMGLRKWPRAIPANASTTGVPPTTTKSTEGSQGSGSGSTTLTSASSSNTREPVPIDLNDAKPGAYANVTEDDGEPAIQMKPPANAEASFTIDVDTTEELSAGELAKILASVNVGGENTGPRLQMFVNDSPVFDKDLVPTNGKFQQVTSDNFKSSSDLRIKMVQKNGDESIEIILKDARIQAVDSSTRTDSADTGRGTDGSSSGSGSGSGSGAGTGTGAAVPTGTGAAGPTGTGSAGPTGTGSAAPTGSESAAGRYDFMANKGAVYIISLIAAFLF